MSKLPAKYDPQNLQEKYELWCKLHRQQDEAQKQWLEAETLLAELQEYYQSEQWMKDHESNLELEYHHGEYSILSEDTLWNALFDRDEQAKRWIRLGLNAIDDQ